MTKGDAYKALCPYNQNRHCVADLCPKWRWEPLETCRVLTGATKSCIHCAAAKMTEQQRNELKANMAADAADPYLYFCTHKCADRHGHCG